MAKMTSKSMKAMPTAKKAAGVAKKAMPKKMSADSKQDAALMKKDKMNPAQRKQFEKLDTVMDSKKMTRKQDIKADTALAKKITKVGNGSASTVKRTV